MKRAKVFALAPAPGLLAAVVAMTPAAAQDDVAQAQFVVAAQDEATRAQLVAAARDYVSDTQPSPAAQDEVPDIPPSLAAQAEVSDAPPSVAAQGEAPEIRLPEADGVGFGPVDRFLDETRTLQAEFSQELLDGGGNLIEEASGLFYLKRPNRFLWSYSEPFEQQVVADAENLWIHDVELEQVTVSPLAGAIASSPAMLLSGDGQVRDGFEIVEASGDGAIAWISLAPREPGVGFSSVQVGFDDGELFALVLVDALGQMTSIQFRNVVVNLEIEDEFFRFEPPAGADLIGEPVDNAR